MKDETVWKQKVTTEDGEVEKFSSWKELADEFSLRNFLVENIKAHGYLKPTPVQANVSLKNISKILIYLLGNSSYPSRRRSSCLRCHWLRKNSCFFGPIIALS